MMVFLASIMATYTRIMDYMQLKVKGGLEMSLLQK